MHLCGKRIESPLNDTSMPALVPSSTRGCQLKPEKEQLDLFAEEVG